MRTFLSVILMLSLSVALAFAAGIDGKWVSEMKRQGPDGQEMVFKTTFDFKSSGNTLTGSVTMPGRPGSEPRTVEFKDGKIDGNNFSFTVVSNTPRGEMKSEYKGTVEGDTLKGTRSMMDREMPFEAKRAQ